MRNVSIEDSPQRRAMLYQLMLESTLIVATAGPPGDADAASEPNRRLQLQGGTDEDGTWVPVFTSLSRLQRWEPTGGSWTAMAARPLFEMLERGGTGKVVVDPASDVWGIIPRHAVEAMARGDLPTGVPTQLVNAAGWSFEVPLGQLPIDGINAVRAAVTAAPNVTRAFITRMSDGDLPAAARRRPVFAATLPAETVERVVGLVAADAGGRCVEVRDWRFFTRTRTSRHGSATEPGRRALRR